MDPLSDLLRSIRLDGAFFYAVEAKETWCIESPAATELSPRILPGAEHLISYHILTEGHCFGGLLGEAQAELVAGDVIVFPHGDPHVMSSAPDSGRGPRVRASNPKRYPHAVRLGERGPITASFVCGYLGCDRRPFNPLIEALPRRMHMRGLSNGWLGNFTGQLTEESSRGRAGADTVLTKLAELMFVELLRRYLDDLPAGQTGWLAGLRDEVVARVLALVHARPGHPWTLADLAREAAASRTNLTKRFTQIMGQPPMQYLAQWRMQVAANLLAQTGAKVSAVGAEVGYDSEAAFSRAFKKATAVSPGAWRQSRRSARA